MSDVQIENPASGEAAAPRRPRRPRTATTAGTTTTRRRSLRGADLIESLRESVEQLIKENRLLKRQLARATAGGGTSAMPGAERTLRSIQRKVLRAVGTDGSARRRTRTAATTSTTRRRTSRTSSTSRTPRTAGGAGD